MGWAELLEVLGEEAAREARQVRAAAAEEAARILAEARGAAETALGVLEAREGESEGVRRRGVEAEAALLLGRARLLSRRTLAAELKAEVARRLQAVALDDAALARLLAELCAEAPAGPFTLVADPGEGERLRALLAAARPELAPRASIQESPWRRGGVELTAGRLWLDDTLPARLERAWPALEGPLLQALLEGR